MPWLLTSDQWVRLSAWVFYRRSVVTVCLNALFLPRVERTGKQMDRQTDWRIAALLNALYTFGGRGICLSKRCKIGSKFVLFTFASEFSIVSESDDGHTTRKIKSIHAIFITYCYCSLLENKHTSVDLIAETNRRVLAGEICWETLRASCSDVDRISCIRNDNVTQQSVPVIVIHSGA